MHTISRFLYVGLMRGVLVYISSLSRFWRKHESIHRGPWILMAMNTKCPRKGWTKNTKSLLVESKSWPNFPLVKGPRLKDPKFYLAITWHAKWWQIFEELEPKEYAPPSFPGVIQLFVLLKVVHTVDTWINFYLGLGSLSKLASNASYKTICIKLA